MSTANEHQEDTATDMPSELTQPLGALCSALVAKLTAQCVRFDDLNARFAAIQHIVARAISNGSKDWNAAHDRLRVLPLELRAMCWSYLPQSDLVGLACVCSSWRDLSRSIPSLWTTLDVTGPVTDLDVLLSRSGRLLLDVSLSVHSLGELPYVDECVRKHADRLRALRLSVRNAGTAENVLEHEFFRYPVPVLAHFSFQLPDTVYDGDFELPEDIFNCHAPHLLSLTLNETPFPYRCPASSNLTELTFQWSLDVRGGDILNAFRVSPSLERLALLKFLDMGDLPPVPASSKLRKITLTADGSCFSSLQTRGYLDVPQLEVTSRDPRALLLAARHPDPSLRATLSLAAAGETIAELVLHSERGATATLTADNGGLRTPSVILEHAPAFPRLHRLIIPTSAGPPKKFPGSADIGFPYLPADLHLPELRTLALAHGPLCGFSIFDEDLVRGVIAVPNLSRLEIIRAGSCQAETLDVSDAINPGLLAVLIEEHIDCGDPAALELYISAENIDLLDVADEEGMARLRDCVGKIIYGDSAS